LRTLARVRQVGPDLPSGVRRPDRSVSLRDVRDLPVQTMGLGEDAERFLRGEMPESEAPNEDVERRGSINIGGLLSRYLQLPPTQQEFVARSWADENPDLANPWKEDAPGGGQPLQQVVTWWGEQAPGFFDFRSQGLSDEDRRLVEQPGGFTPSPPMSGTMPGASLQPPRSPAVGGFQASPPLSGMLPGAPLRGPQGPTVLSMEGQQALPGMLTPEEDAKERERQRNLEAVKEARRRLQHGNPPEPPNHLDDLNPQSQMSQTMLADMFAQRAAQQQNQSQQGYFGGLGQAVGGMSTEQKIALAIGLGLLTGGMSTPMMGPALGVGAGLAVR
jgi:hypothetical protein